MVSEGARAQPLSPLLGAACFVVLVAGLKAAASLVVPFLLALFVAIICSPALFALRERGLPRWLALTLVISATGTLFGMLVLALGTSVTGFTQALPGYQEQLRTLVDGAAARLHELGMPGLVDELRTSFDTSYLLRLIGSLVSDLGNALTNAVFILLTAVFILLEAASFQGKLAATSRDPETALERFGQILRNVRRYLALKTATSLATGAIIAGGLVLLGVDFPLLWGLLAFLLNFVPNIGSILAAIPGVLQALVQLGWGTALAASLLYLAVNMVVGNGVEPRLMGRSIGLSTLVVFGSLVFWGWVLGPVGMLLSVPLTMTLKIALENSPSTHWIAVLLGPPIPEQEIERAESSA
ncbi:MAG: AI-2E family transporter [Myxococcota bacterium]|nr:AI-2E family transporter [Myxococcota bacterium]